MSDAPAVEQAQPGPALSGPVASPSASNPVVIRDESDEIIDNLKRQLNSLQQELARYQGAERSGSERAGAGAPPKPPSAGGRREWVEGWNASLTPYLAVRLQQPAEELTQRLARLIEQVSDPDLRQELELCRETAFFITGTFRRIRDNHRLLTESLIAEKISVGAPELVQHLRQALQQRGLAPPHLSGLEGGAGLRLAPVSAATVLAILTELAGTVFGGSAQASVSLERATGGISLRLRVTTGGAWEGLQGDDVSAVAFRSGVRAGSVVDLLYVQKIVELQGGSLGFHRREGQVFGFELHWPCG